MKTLMTIVAAAVMMGGAAAAEDADRSVAVCGFGPKSGPRVYAEAEARRLFAKIDVDLRWFSEADCPDGTMQVQFAMEAARADHPKALAYALPYEKTHIVVFMSRIREAVTPDLVPTLLAHVLVHEIAHMIQGVARHSPDGIMMAAWKDRDYQKMARYPLPFGHVDIVFINAGLARRQAANAAAGQMTQISEIKD